MIHFYQHNECKVIVKLKKDAGIIEGNKRKLPGMLGDPDFYIDYEEDVDRAIEFFVNVPRDVETLCPLKDIREITFIGNSINDYGRGLITKKGITLVTLVMEYFHQRNLPRPSNFDKYKYQVKAVIEDFGGSEKLSVVVYRYHKVNKTVETLLILSKYSYQHTVKEAILSYFYQEIITNVLDTSWIKMEPVVDSYERFEPGLDEALIEVQGLINNSKQE